MDGGEHIQYYWAVHLKMVEMVSFVLYVFYPDNKNWKKKILSRNWWEERKRHYCLLGTEVQVGKMKKTSGDAWWCRWLHNVNVHNTTESNTKNCYSGKFYGMYILPQLQKLFWVKLVSLSYEFFQADE